MSTILSTGGVCVVALGGACMVLFGGCAWFYLGACVVLFGGACVVLFGGCVWFYLGGMRSFISRGACVVLFWGGGMRGFFSFFGYNEIRSMSGRYASYWNAFLLPKGTRCQDKGSPKRVTVSPEVGRLPHRTSQPFVHMVSVACTSFCCTNTANLWFCKQTSLLTHLFYFLDNWELDTLFFSSGVFRTF